MLNWPIPALIRAGEDKRCWPLESLPQHNGDEQKLTQSEKVRNGIFSRKWLFWCRNVILSVFGQAIKGEGGSWGRTSVNNYFTYSNIGLLEWNVFCFVLCRALPVVSIRRMDVFVLLRIVFSYSAEVAWKDFWPREVNCFVFVLQLDAALWLVRLLPSGTW